jgi:hypothetical protein
MLQSYCVVEVDGHLHPIDILPVVKELPLPSG